MLVVLVLVVLGDAAETPGACAVSLPLIVGSYRYRGECLLSKN